MSQDFTAKTKEMIDDLKGICATYGLGNDGNEYKIITQVFLYKFMNDKFGYELKQLDPRLKKAEKWEKEIGTYSEKEYRHLLMRMGGKSAKLEREHFITYLYNKQNEPDFAKLFDKTLMEISIKNETFSVITDAGEKVKLFDELSNYVADPSKRDKFCRAIINRLVLFNFENVFHEKFDFFATIFEYLIKDYNKDGGRKYAEYFTPYAVSKIMASILVDEPVSNVTCYDPSAGSGTLLMNLAHIIGEDNCSIYSQDISQKSSGMLRLNLILNNLVHSIQHVVQGNTLTDPSHKKDGKLMKFDYVVSNPPFKLDFSDWRDDLDTKENNERFFAGYPKIPPKKKDAMEIYLLFIQHIIYSLSPKGKAAVVVPTGFLTAQSGIQKKIKEKLVEEKMLRGVVSMPSNIFATTGTNVSILFLDKGNTNDEVILMDASNLGTKIKEGKNQRTVLSHEENEQIIDTFIKHEVVEDFTVVVSYEKIKNKNYSLSAGQYFIIKIQYVDLTPGEFQNKLGNHKEDINSLFCQSKKLESKINKIIGELEYE